MQMSTASASVPGQKAAGQHVPCPDWCVVGHGTLDGEEDWLHLSEPIRLASRVEARMALTLGPSGQAFDGPYLIIGSETFTPAEASALGAAITAIAEAAERLSPLEQSEGALPVLHPQLPQH